MLRSCILLIAALGLAACHKGDTGGGNASVTAGADASSGWAAQAVATAEGGIRMGRSEAPVKLVEYGSYTCPHCAAFDAEAMPTIRQWVAAGKLSYEMRNFIRDSFDLSAALLARCGGPESFFPLSDQIFAGQQEWLGNAQSMTASEAKEIDALPPTEQLYQITRITGLNGYAGKHGVTADRLHQCLTDQAAADRLIQTAKAGETQYKIEGTPTFILDGKVLGSPDWAGIKPELTAAIGG